MFRPSHRLRAARAPVDLRQVDAVGPVVSARGPNLGGPGGLDAPNDLHLLGESRDSWGNMQLGL